VHGTVGTGDVRIGLGLLSRDCSVYTVRDHNFCLRAMSIQLSPLNSDPLSNHNDKPRVKL